MNKNGILLDISDPMATRSSTVTLSIHGPRREKVTRKQPPKLTQWEAVHQMWCGNQVNGMSRKR